MLLEVGDHARPGSVVCPSGVGPASVNGDGRRTEVAG
jgi:hypothetical protein